MAYSFPGSGAHRVFELVPFTDLTTYTLGCWVRMNATQAGSRRWVLLGYDDGVSTGRGIAFADQGADSTIKYLEPGVAYRGTGYTMTFGVWTFLCITREPSSGNVNFYVNGKLYETTVAGPSNPSGTDELSAGATLGGVGAPDGSIGPIFVAQRSLSPLEVMELYKSVQPRGNIEQFATRYYTLNSLKDSIKGGVLTVSGSPTVTGGPEIPMLWEDKFLGGAVDGLPTAPAAVLQLGEVRAVPAFDLPQKETKSYGVYFLPPPPPPLALPNSLKTKVTAHDPTQKQTTSHGVYIVPAQLAPPNRLITKIVAHDPVQKITTPFSKFFLPPALKPPSVKKVVAHDPVQKFVRETRFTLLSTLGKIEFHATLADTQRRFSFTVGDMPGSGTFVPGTGRFTLTEGRRRYSVNVGGTL